MEILLWLVPTGVVTLVAMLWVAWLGREGRGEVDRDVAVQRLAARDAARAPRHPARSDRSRPATAAPASPYALPGAAAGAEASTPPALAPDFLAG